MRTLRVLSFEAPVTTGYERSFTSFRKAEGTGPLPRSGGLASIGFMRE